MKKAARVQILQAGSGLYGKMAVIKNCIEENGEFYYYLKIDGQKGLTLVHESGVKVL